MIAGADARSWACSGGCSRGATAGSRVTEGCQANRDARINNLLGGLAVGGTEADVFCVGEGLFDELADVVVVKAVNDVASVTFSSHEPLVAQQPELVRERRSLRPGRPNMVRRTGCLPCR